MRKTLYINSISGVLLLLFSSVLVFIAIPLFIRKLGNELYGVYALLMLLGNINNFANIGITAALIKSLAEQGKGRESSIDIFTTYILFITIILPISVLLIVFQKFFLIYVFSVPVKLVNGDVMAFYVCLVLANAITFVGQICTAILDAAQKIYITNILSFVYNFLYWGLFLIVLLFSTSMAVLGAVIFGVAIIWFGLVFNYSIKSWGQINFIPQAGEIKQSLHKQFSYGSKLYFSGILNFIFEPFTKILISNFIGIREVGYFDIGLRIKYYLWTMMQKVQYPLLPFLASLQDTNKIRSVVHNFEQKFALVLMPTILTLIFTAFPFTHIWLGNNPASDIIALSIVLITSGALIGIELGPNYHFLTIKGHPEKTIVMQFVNLSVNIIIFFGFKSLLGYYSAILGNFIALIASTVVNLYYQKKYLNSLIWDSLAQFFKFCSITAIILFANIIVMNFHLPYLKSLLLIPLINIFGAVLLYRFFSMITPSDIQTYLGNSKYASPISKLFIRRT